MTVLSTKAAAELARADTLFKQRVRVLPAHKILGAKDCLARARRNLSRGLYAQALQLVAEAMTTMEAGR